MVRKKHVHTGEQSDPLVHSDSKNETTTLRQVNSSGFNIFNYLRGGSHGDVLDPPKYEETRFKAQRPHVQRRSKSPWAKIKPVTATKPKPTPSNPDMGEPPQPEQSGTNLPPKPYKGSKKLAKAQSEVDQVVDIMRQTVEKTLDRDENLTQMQERADDLTVQAAEFKITSRKLKRKMCCRNCYYTMVAVCLVIIVIVCVLVYLELQYGIFD